jgi:hypothetical protein
MRVGQAFLPGPCTELAYRAKQRKIFHLSFLICQFSLKDKALSIPGKCIEKIKGPTNGK